MAVRSIHVLLALAAAAAPAAAEPAFGWSAPAGCPRADDVRARVERRLGSPIDGAVRGVEIEITRTGSEFVARIDARALTVANDIRTVRSTRCDELADGIAVILARLASEVRSAPPPATELATPKPPPREVALADELRGPDDERRSDVIAIEPAAPRPEHLWGGGVRLLGLSGIGALPRLNLGGEVSGYVRRDRRFAELAISRWVPQSARLDPGAPARVDVSLDVLTVRAGWATEQLPIRAWLSGEVGRMRGSGMAVIDPKVVTSPWAAVGAGFGVAWPMAPRARLVGTFELAVPLSRTTFSLQGGADLFQPSPAAVRCAFGLELGWR